MYDYKSHVGISIKTASNMFMSRSNCVCRGIEHGSEDVLDKICDMLTKQTFMPSMILSNI